MNPAEAEEVTLGNADTGNYNFNLKSYSELPFRTVVRQQFDYSCGSAALATLLRYHYSVPTSEADIFKAMFAVGDQAKIQKQGFSLLDMKKYLSTLGYQADGYRLGVDQLQRLKIPAIALIQIGTYKHFVVIKGVVGDEILIGDPARGLREVGADEFVKSWNGVAFLVHERPTDGFQPIFNSAEEWKKWSNFHALDASVLAQTLAPLLRDLPFQYQIEANQMLTDPLGR